jgi:hypothetical protein
MGAGESTVRTYSGRTTAGGVDGVHTGGNGPSSWVGAIGEAPGATTTGEVSGESTGEASGETTTGGLTTGGLTGGVTTGGVTGGTTVSAVMLAVVLATVPSQQGTAKAYRPASSPLRL